MPSPEQIAAAFSKIVVHDDTVQAIAFRPGKGRTDRHRGDPQRGSVEVQLYRFWEKCTRQLVFKGCVNVGLRVDATMLAYNMPSSTTYAEGTADTDVIRQLIGSHTPYWHCTFDPPGCNPVIQKLTEIDQFVLFRLQMYGGLLEVIAKSFTLRTLKGKASPAPHLAGKWGISECGVIFSESSTEKTSQPRVPQARRPRLRK